MTPAAFEGSLTVRTPNPWLLGLSFAPFALAALAFAHGILTGSAAPFAIPHLTIMGVLAVVTVLTRRPFARYATAPVRVDGEGLRVGDDVTPKPSITRALFVPQSLGDVPLVRVERFRRSAVELVVRDEAEAQQLLAALGHDVSRATSPSPSASREASVATVTSA